uniref:Uncharacterized protein n=1 Tax=Anopheles arabiensis TaxID=7173 RepID=A0A182IFJ8_ANOAR
MQCQRCFRCSWGESRPVSLSRYRRTETQVHWSPLIV